MKNRCFLVILMATMLYGHTHSAQTKIDIRPTVAKPAADPRYGCLPPDIQPGTIVEVKTIKSSVGIRVIKETVLQRLVKIGARCRAGKLVDRNRRGIRFYQLQGCWGNPPADYLEILETGKKELRELKKKFTVIEITCNPSGLMPF